MAGASGSVAHPLTLIWLSHGRGQQLGDCPPNAAPDQSPVMVATFEHLIGTLRRHYLSVGSMVLRGDLDARRASIWMRKCRRMRDGGRA
jgi:hypothetical protein